MIKLYIDRFYVWPHKIEENMRIKGKNNREESLIIFQASLLNIICDKSFVVRYNN